MPGTSTVGTSILTLPSSCSYQQRKDHGSPILFLHLPHTSSIAPRHLHLCSTHNLCRSRGIMAKRSFRGISFFPFLPLLHLFPTPLPTYYLPLTRTNTEIVRNRKTSTTQSVNTQPPPTTLNYPHLTNTPMMTTMATQKRAFKACWMNAQWLFAENCTM